MNIRNISKLTLPILFPNSIGTLKRRVVYVKNQKEWQPVPRKTQRKIGDSLELDEKKTIEFDY